MILEQYYLGCLAHASYLVGDGTSGVAAVVDPQRDVDQYLADAGRLGVEIRFVFLTHFHADFVAGHLELRDRVGAEICLGARAEAEYAFRGLASGDTLELGPETRLEVLETPGHSPESITILVYDLERDRARPYAALTGDTLFIGDVGRPDLRASLGWTAEELGGLLYDSVHGKLLPLPDDTLVYPGHGAGSLCGKNLSTDTVSTMGIQRRYNYALQPMGREEFVRIVTADQPDSPSYFTYDAILNTKERPTLEASLEQALAPLSLDAVLQLEADGAHLLDVRTAADFAGAHLRGSVNIGLDGSFATWSGTLLDPSHPIVVIADPGREDEAATRLGRIGFDNVAGYLEGGMQALEPRPEHVSRTERVTAQTLAEQLEHDPRPFVLDVRTDGERQEGSIDGSVHVPLSRLLGQLDVVPVDRDVVVVCGSGYRSSIASSLLQRDGREQVTDLVGGMAAWSASRLATGAPAA
jgi:glyoxylase-like metal-dependent hydrolase (beta-lactamase superfamily II)/rhodanese-related sulfurtransferase